MKKDANITCPKCKGKATTQIMSVGGNNFLEVAICPTCKVKKLKTSFSSVEIYNQVHGDKK